VDLWNYGFVLFFNFRKEVNVPLREALRRLISFARDGCIVQCFSTLFYKVPLVKSVLEAPQISKKFQTEFFPPL
jgi:hypothetical protein